MIKKVGMMITEDISFFLWQVKCDGCGDIKIFYKEDASTYEDLCGELLARDWTIVPEGETYCLKCSEKLDGR